MKQLLSVLFIVLAANLFSQTISTPAQAYNVTISNIGTNSFKISWTPPSSTGVMVVVKPASFSRTAPVNANMPSYSASASYASGTNLGNANYLVYMGNNSTTNVTVTNLGSDYNFEVIVYAYNYGCVNYNALIGCLQFGYLANTSYSSTNSEIHYTLATQPTVAPTLSVIGTPGPTSATLSFNGSSTWNLISVYNPNTSNYYTPVDGTFYTPSTTYGSGNQIGGAGTNNFSVYSSNANNSVNINNLAPATGYYGVAFGYNGTGTSTNNSFNYSNTIAWVYFSTLNSAPTLNAISNYTVCQDAATTNVPLSGITKGTNAAETQTISIYATSSNTLLIPNPTVYYTNPNSTGSITFKPNIGQSGTAIITVTANDGGPNNGSTVKTFTVTVKGIPYAAGAISTATTTLCKVKNGVVFSVPTISNTTTYNWALPPNATVTAGANTNSITVNFSITANSYNVSVYGSNTNGCGNGTNSSILVNFDNVPTASNAGSNQLICNNLTALAANAPSIGTGAWTFCSSGLGSLSSTTTPNTNLQVVNNQTVTAVWTITNGVCPASTSSVVVTNINGSPSCTPYADFVANNTEICVNSTVTFSNTSVAAVGVNTYTWNFGAGATPATSTSTAAAITVTYSSVGTKTVTLAMNNGTGGLTMTKNAYINVITVPTAPTLITGNTTVCQGKTAEPYFINTVTNATGYSWTFPSGVVQNTGANTNVISANFSTTATSGNVGVSASNACGSSSITILAISVNPLPTQASAITGSNTVCQGVNGVVYVANNLNNGLSYTWSTPNGANIVSGLNTRTITVNYDNSSTTGVMSVYGTNGCGDGATKNKVITVNPLPGTAGTISGSISNNVCPLSTNINYSVAPVSNATSYTWIYPSGYSVASGANTNSIFLDATLNATNGGIKVVGTNACGAGDTSSVLNVNVSGLPTQQICVVTVDSSSVYNEIIWQKNGASNVDSFRVYRVQSLILDTLIGTVDYADLSKFVDVTANPNVTSSVYKIAAVDFCGNEGPKSLEHKTIHLVYNYSAPNMNLSWNQYSGATVINYRVLRDTNYSGNWTVLINSIPPNVTSYTDFSIPANANSVQYRVDVIWANSCDPTAKVAQSIVNTSKSNTKDFVINIVTSIAEQNEFLNAISLYPNPTKDVFDIELKAGIESFDVEIYNQLGASLKSTHLTYTDKATIDISEFSTGIYFVVVKTKMGSVTKRVTKL
ncbi:MAG: T9SS type A sorting domain-containing protein [Bacteroidia bacterium]|nr:T9SS type A sorting domain-containing protein [Bacteroidia bacterium]